MKRLTDKQIQHQQQGKQKITNTLLAAKCILINPVLLPIFKNYWLKPLPSLINGVHVYGADKLYLIQSVI